MGRLPPRLGKQGEGVPIEALVAQTAVEALLIEGLNLLMAELALRMGDAIQHVAGVRLAPPSPEPAAPLMLGNARFLGEQLLAWSLPTVRRS